MLTDRKDYSSHCDQHLTFDRSTLYTGGCDCLVRIWNSNGGTDQEPSAAVEADQPVTCVAAAVSF
jgi:chromosome transmission fidelity protein 4